MTSSEAFATPSPETSIGLASAGRTWSKAAKAPVASENRQAEMEYFVDPEVYSAVSESCSPYSRQTFWSGTAAGDAAPFFQSPMVSGRMAADRRTGRNSSNNLRTVQL